LLAWYAEHARDLPWRRTSDPYAILVSEIMLQQTQVDRVAPKYLEFLERFPSLPQLAAASRAEVIRAWSPLGYNRRAVHLHVLAQRLVAENGGRLPATVEQLQALEGIGRYTAGAVACFANGQPVSVVDTNVRRVLRRVFEGLLPEEQTAQVDAELADEVLAKEAASAFNQALMDLGATICVARAPRCERCPVQPSCDTGRPLPTSLPTPIRRAAEERSPYRAGYSSGTTRFVRGRIVESLRRLPDGALAPLDEIDQQADPAWDPTRRDWLLQLARGLERDGLVRLVSRAGSEPLVGLA
jgi:A/G-specific adenine glycosylase